MDLMFRSLREKRAGVSKEPELIPIGFNGKRKVTIHVESAGQEGC